MNHELCQGGFETTSRESGLRLGELRDELPTEVYMLRNKVTGKLYKRRWPGSTPLVWTSIQGPASARGHIRGPTRQDWRIIKLKVTDEA